MAQVPSNLIPTRVTQLPDAPTASEDSLLMIVYQGVNYKIRAGDLLQVAGVPTSRQVIAGTGLQGGGQLSSNVTLSVAPGGITTPLLADSGVTPGGYGSATSIPVITVDATGRVMAATSVPLEVAGYVPESREVIAGTGLTGGGSLSANVTLDANLSDAVPVVGSGTGEPGVSDEIARADHAHPAVDLASDSQVDGLLGLSNGGTARSLVPEAGAIIWCGADGLYVGPVGEAGQVLVSNGSGEYEWGAAVMITPQSANTFFAGPVSGGVATPSFRSIVNADLPDSGVVPGAYGSSTLIPVISVDEKGVVTSATEAVFSGAVTSVNGQTGVVVLDYVDVGAPSVTGLGASGTWSIDITGNSATVTNGVYTIGSYADPAWLTSLSTGKLSGTISNAQLANSSITINGSLIGLGGSATVTAVNPNALTIGSGLSGTSYNGSAAVTITNTAPDQVVSIANGAAISVTGTYPSFTVTNTAPDQVVSLTQGGTTTITGTYPNFTISSSDAYTGTVTSVATGTGLTGGPITTSGTVGFSVPAVGTWAATPSSANLRAAMTDETGTGALVFADGPSISGPTIDGANPFVQYSDGTAVALAAGRMWYNGTTGSLNFGMGGGNITQQVGEELFKYGKTTSAVSDTTLQLIYKTGTVGASGVVTFAPTVPGITDDNSIIGIATEPIGLNSFGRVTTFGTVRGIDTSGTPYGEVWADNDVIWYNPVTGGLTKVKPVAPNIKCQIGTVINAAPGGAGSFDVEVIHGTQLGGTDSNVQLTSISGGDLLQYDAGLGYWKNVSASSVTGVGSASNLAGGAASQIPYQTGAGATGFIANGTSGQLLSSNGASSPSWSSLKTVNSTSLLGSGDLPLFAGGLTKIEKVSALPGSPDPTTLYIVV